MKKNKVVTESDIRMANDLIVKIPSVKGEKRVIYKCEDCGQLFGHRFIPFSLSHGLLVNACLCQLTGHRGSVTVLESTP